MTPYGASLFPSLAFSIFPLFWRAHATVRALDGAYIRGLVVEMTAAFHFSCLVVL